MLLGSTITFNLQNINELAIIITLVGYVVVFIALAALVVVIGRIATLQNLLVRIRLRSTKKSNPEKIEAETPPVSLTADENAAICTALYLYFTELHDEEKYVMTVKKVSRAYSPWSSKIYGIMNISKRG
jgi:Na+-transporting methylmalonyl-CoA/oxaloacetate decarboxylase gamma subunit